MLEIKDFTLKSGENKILENINLRISDGECVLLTGESGSGKTSIINSINSLSFYYENLESSGSIKVDDREIKNLELYETSLIISSVFQNPKTHFFNVNTTLELLFYLENIGLTTDEMDKRMDETLKLFPIEHLLGRSIFELSGGEKQILCVACAYISGCKIIVLDEPSANLDEKHIEIIKEMLKKLKSKKITLILAEHRIYYAMEIVDKIYLIKNGKIEKAYTKQEFLELSDEKITEWGLRAREKTPLQIKEITKGKDLLIKNINLKFEDKCELKIEELSFDMGKIYGIVGRNGCGKSNFFRVMTGLNKKDKSKIYLDGKEMTKKERLKNSSLVMQDVNDQLFSDSVEEELKLGIKNLAPEKIEEILEALGLIHLKERHPMSLSGGEKQRVSIASVICKNSKFIYFDEPTSGMDYKNMLKISKLIKAMKRDDNIIFIISHDIEFLNMTAEEIINLERFNNKQ